MSGIKTEFRFFTIVDYEKEAKYLEKRHAQGWEFTNVHLPGIYRFIKCDPEEVVYQLDYNQEGIKEKVQYVQMFQDCGWEYIKDFVGYSYFRKPVSEMDGREQIFCDDASRIDMMKRVFKGRMCPLLVVFFCIILPQVFAPHSSHGFLSPLNIAFIVMLVLYLAIFIGFGVKYRNFKSRIKK